MSSGLERNLVTEQPQETGVRPGLLWHQGQGALGEVFFHAEFYVFFFCL